jgi:4'-phosphopantetheinyl transferase
MTALWRPGPVRPELQSNEVHIWMACLEMNWAQLERLEATLAPDEQAHGMRMRFLRDRALFIAARGILREILGRYLRCEPDSLKFCYNSAGKPTLASESDNHELRFNLSHSDGIALYAVSMLEVGIDVERIQPRLVEGRIADLFFSTNEISAFHGVSPSAQVDAFFHYWTAKEAYIKARGEGFRIPTDSPTISLAPSKSAGLVSGDCSWSFQSLTPALGYVGSVVAKGSNWSLKFWEWA